MSAVLALALLPAEAPAKSIAKDQVNIRAEPSRKAAILFTAPLGYPIEIENEVDQWAFFKDWQNRSGWVFRSLVADIDTAVIQVDKANIRTSASERSQVVVSGAMGEIYQILGKQGNWVRLGYYHDGSAVGWVRTDLIFGE